MMRDVLLMTAGMAGILVATVHGLIGEARILPSLKKLPEVNRRVLAAVYRISAIYWLAGGLALLAAPVFMSGQSRWIVAVTVAAMFAAGAAGNFWATRGRHFGWMLLAVAALFAFIGR